MAFRVIEYYVYPTLLAAQATLTVIDQWAPIVGTNKGKPAPDKQQTVRWMSGPKEMLTGEYAVYRITPDVIQAVGASQSYVDDFLTDHVPEIRVLAQEDFVSL